MWGNVLLLFCLEIACGIGKDNKAVIASNIMCGAMCRFVCYFDRFLPGECMWRRPGCGAVIASNIMLGQLAAKLPEPHTNWGLVLQLE